MCVSISRQSASLRVTVITHQLNNNAAPLKELFISRSRIILSIIMNSYFMSVMWEEFEGILVGNGESSVLFPVFLLNEYNTVFVLWRTSGH